MVNTWLAWFDEWDDVHPCSPVILQLESGNLELWAVYVSGFDVTWNTVDLAEQPFSWLNERHDAIKGTRWVKDVEPLLQNAKGQTIQEVSILLLSNIFNGICLKLDNGFLAIQNSDELLISNSIADYMVEINI